MRLLYVLLVAATSVVDALSDSENLSWQQDRRDTWCYRVGEPCYKLKRAHDVIAEILAEPSKNQKPEIERHRECFLPGSPCPQAKRDGLDLAQAVAQAHASVEAQASPTNPLVARQTFRPPFHCETDMGHIGSFVSGNGCYRTGEPCWKVKRAAETVAELFAQDPVGPSNDTEASSHSECYRPGAVCDNAQQTLDDLLEKLRSL